MVDSFIQSLVYRKTILSYHCNRKCFAQTASQKKKKKNQLDFTTRIKRCLVMCVRCRIYPHIITWSNALLRCCQNDQRPYPLSDLRLHTLSNNCHYYRLSIHRDFIWFNDKTAVRFALTNDTPYLALTGELWGVFRELYKEKWRYIESTLYWVSESFGEHFCPMHMHMYLKKIPELMQQ